MCFVEYEYAYSTVYTIQYTLHNKCTENTVRAYVIYVYVVILPVVQIKKVVSI